MNEEIMSIRGWVGNALDSAVKKGNEKRKVSDYDRGRIAGIISAYQHVMVETSQSNAWIPKQHEPYDALNTWIREITLHSPLTIAAAIKIYDFCDRNDLLKRHNIIEKIIALSLKGHTWQDITNLLKLEALKGGNWIHRGVWGRRSRDE